MASSSVYGLPHKARCLTALPADTEANLFLAGTTSLSYENEVHLICVGGNKYEASRSAAWPHPGELWHLSACPSSPTLFSSVYRDRSGDTKATVWSGSPQDAVLKPQAHFPAAKYCAVEFECKRDDASEGLLAVEQKRVGFWSIEGGTIKEQFAREEADMTDLRGGKCDPHFRAQFAVFHDGAVSLFDLRSPKRVHKISDAHGGLSVRDLDYNPNKPHQIATCGDDCRIRFWDARASSKPLKTLSHSHWVLTVRYHPAYDQLVISGSSDCCVKLWNVGGISSQGGVTALLSGPAGDSAAGSRAEDAVVHTYEEHEESVRALAWSAASSWLFASLSHDGRVVTNFVPQDEADKIMLHAP